MRGLKRILGGISPLKSFDYVIAVAPHTGAWIETVKKLAILHALNRTGGGFYLVLRQIQESPEFSEFITRKMAFVVLL